MDGMLAEMSWGQYTGWMEYAQLEPFGEERADLRMGILASLTANLNRDAKRHPNPFQATDFMPFWKSPSSNSGGARAPLTKPSQWAAFKSLAKSLAGAK